MKYRDSAMKVKEKKVTILSRALIFADVFYEPFMSSADIYMC